MASPIFHAGTAAQATGSGSLTLTIGSYAVPVLVDGFLIVGTGCTTGTTTVSSIIFNGSTNLVRIGRLTNTSPAVVELWGVPSPPNATGNLVITINATAPVGAVACCYDNVDQGSSPGSYVSGSGNGSSGSLALVYSPGDLAVGAFARSAAITLNGTSRGSMTISGTTVLFNFGDIPATSNFNGTWSPGGVWTGNAVPLFQTIPSVAPIAQVRESAGVIGTNVFRT